MELPTSLSLQFVPKTLLSGGNTYNSITLGLIDGFGNPAQAPVNTEVKLSSTIPSVGANSVDRNHTSWSDLCQSNIHDVWDCRCDADNRNDFELYIHKFDSKSSYKSCDKLRTFDIS